MKKTFKNLLIFLLSIGGLFSFNSVLAQNFGLNTVRDGLAGSLASGDPRTVIARIITLALGFLGIIAVSLIIYSGFIWMTAGGNEEKISQAKKILRDATIGLIIILASWGIATFIISKLGGAANGNGNGNGNGGGGCVGLDCIYNPPCTGPDCTPPPPPCAGSVDPNCQPESGHPVITGISPEGGFCTNNSNKPCRSDSDCSPAVCDLITPNGAPDNFITIFGKNFGNYSATSSSVVFEGQGTPISAVLPQSLNPSCINSWTNTQIIIAVPKGVVTGALKIINSGGKSDLSNDNYGPKIPDFQANSIVRPGLCQINPTSGALSAKVGYSGINLYSGKAYFGNYQSNVPALQSSFSNSGLIGTSTIPNIRAGISSSFVQTIINGFPELSNYLVFTKQAEPGSGPFISSFSPISGNSGQYVTITGSGFGDIRGSSQVFFGKTEASYDFPKVCLNSVWTNNQIIVKVPKGLSAGAQIITIKIGQTTISTKTLNPNIFKFDKDLALKTSLCRISPVNGPAGTPISLWGEYFGPTDSKGMVNFNYSIGSITNGQATGTIQQKSGADLIQTVVPSGAITGPVKVIKNNDWGNYLNFNIGSCTANTDCGGNQVCCPQNTYRKGRCAQTLKDCLINIPTSVFEWSFSTGFGTSTDHGPGHGTSTDPCFSLSSSECTASTTCCLDAQSITDHKCRTGVQLTTPTADKGYCAYYDCSAKKATDCASTTPTKDGRYKTLDSCTNDCATQKACSDFSQFDSCQNDTSCCFNKKFDSKLASGTPCQSGQQISGSSLSADNGYCAYYDCQLPPLSGDEKLCATSTPVASGTYSGLQDCITHCTGNLDNLYSRPEIVSTSPANLADKVCRNTLISVNFDQKMDVSSFAKNALLLEARDYGNGVCPVGTFAVKNSDLARIFGQRKQGWWQSIKDRISSILARVNSDLTNSALAIKPDSNKLYCSASGMIYSEKNGDRTSLIFSPKNILDPSATYYLIIKGDQNLDNKTGVLSSHEIGFTGPGFLPSTGVYIPGKLIKFNNTSYINSQIIEFSTLASSGPTSGICAIDHVHVSPVSYLFNTTNNALKSKEDDSDADISNKTFDTVADSDKVFTAIAYSNDDQLLRPVTGYFWNWDFSLNPKVATIKQVKNLSPNQVFVRANKGITDANTKLIATVDMNNFISGNSVTGDCSCSDLSCSNNCANSYLGGNGFNSSSDLYVFICNNPWPAVNANTGTWSPWVDKSQGQNSPSYNYKFYYCRDAGKAGTTDDLPALSTQPATFSGSILGSGGLKQSYFSRAAILSPATINKIDDQKSGGLVNIEWQSKAADVYVYKIYYLETGKTLVNSRELPVASSLCTTNGGINTCHELISGLTNNVPYVFQISVISVNNTESKLSPGVVVTPTDQTPPKIPNGFQVTAEASSTILKFNWLPDSGDTSYYRLYHGVYSGKYGESFNSSGATTTLSFLVKQFPIGDNYFALSAIDNFNNESEKSSELHCITSVVKISTDTPSGLKVDCQ